MNPSATNSSEDASNVPAEAETVSDPERRLVDGKWMCLNGDGGFFLYENEQWIAVSGEDWQRKWDATPSATDPYHCVIDGIAMEWNKISEQWLPAVQVNEDFLALYHANYGINYDYGSKETTSEESAPKNDQSKMSKKLKPQESTEPPGWVELDESKNTSIYVSNLPLSITEEDFIKFVSKCGVIQRDARTNKFKAKLYRNDDDTPKGDGRCCYIKRESVDLALKILNGWNLDGRIVSVVVAKFQMKGEFDPAKKKKKLTAAQKKRYIENQQRIFDWKPEKPRNYRPISDCTIVMKNMFTLNQMMSDAALLLDLEEEIRKVCERFGVVKKVVVHDNNPEGVLCVTFENVQQSDAAVRALNNRVVDGRKISVSLWDGKTKYTVHESEEQRAERIKNWESHIIAE